MVAHIVRLTLWEWFKLRRRRMPLVLLVVAVILTQMGLWFAYTAYHNETLQAVASGSVASYGVSDEVDGETITFEVSCVSLANEGLPPELNKLPEEMRARYLRGVEEFREESCDGTDSRADLRKSFTIPHSIAESAAGLANYFAPFLIIILAASLVGTEYGSGTLRTTLTRGTGRWQFLASKLFLVMLTCVAALIVVAAAITLASIAASSISPDEVSRFSDAGSWLDAVVSLGKTVYALAPYVALSMFLAVLTQSAAAGTAIALGYYVIELTASPILNVTSWGESITDFILGNNVNEWMESAVVTVEASGAGSAANQTDTLQAFLVILAYTVVLFAAGFWIFLRRDITGAKGE